MQPLATNAFEAAATLIASGDPRLFAIVALSLQVSVAATLLGALVGFPLGALVAVGRFPFRGTLLVVLNAMMGLPPVVVGLAVYLLLSRAGPLGPLGLLFTPAAMVLAQTILVTPILAALARQTLADSWDELGEQLRSLGLTPIAAIPVLLHHCRFSLTTALLAGFGRAAAEVGAVLVVGGNINGVTRTMTTAITLETQKGDLPMALGLGLVLLTVILAVNAAAASLRDWAAREGA